jgi:hypothetical protein
LAGVVGRRLGGLAGVVAVDEHEDCRVAPDQFLPHLFAGVAAGVARAGGAAGGALKVGVGRHDDRYAGVGVDDGLGPGEGRVGRFELDRDVEERPPGGREGLVVIALVGGGAAVPGLAGVT